MGKEELKILINSIKKMLKRMYKYQRGTINLSSSSVIEGYTSSEIETLYANSQNQSTEHADQKRIECEKTIKSILTIIMNLGYSNEEIIKHFKHPDDDYIKIFLYELSVQKEPSKSKK